MNVLFLPQTCLVAGVIRIESSERKAFKVGASMILAFAAFIVLLWAAGYLPGIVGRTFSTITGMLWTPTIMEPTLFLMGLFSILILNHHRRVKEGDECVLMEAPHDSTREIEQPPCGEELLKPVQEALSQGDKKEVRRLLLELPQPLHDGEDVLAIRLQMARDNQDPNNIRGFSRALRELNPQHPLLKS